MKALGSRFSGTAASAARPLFAVSVLSIVMSAPVLAAAPSFTGLGFLAPPPATGNYSTADAVSADGSVVVGMSNGDPGGAGFTAWRWTQATGMVSLGARQSALILGYPTATGVSADGSTVVGRRGTPETAWKHTTAGEVVSLGFLNPINVNSRSAAEAVTADGAVIVGGTRENYAPGSGIPGDPGSAEQAVRWDAATGAATGLGFYPNGDGSIAHDVTPNGSVIVGWAKRQTGNFAESTAFRWTAGGGMQDLGDLPGGDVFSRARAVSADGSTIVGISSGFPSGGNPLSHAFRWTQATGMVALPQIGGTGLDIGMALDVSSDGSIVVGHMGDLVYSALPGDEQDLHAFVWDVQNGTRGAADFLAAAGVTVPAGWTLRSVNAISADGTTLAGDATN